MYLVFVDSGASLGAKLGECAVAVKFGDTGAVETVDGGKFGEIDDDLGVANESVRLLGEPDVASTAGKSGEVEDASVFAVDAAAAAAAAACFANVLGHIDSASSSAWS